MNTIMKFLLTTMLALGALSSNAQDKPATASGGPLPSLDVLLDPEVVKLFATLPVQEMGRVKPMDTVARFRLLRFSGKQSAIKATRMDTSKGEAVAINDPATGKPLLNAKGKPYSLTAIEWLIISWFRPDVAKDLPVFVVDNSDAVTELGLPAKQKRDRYSHNEIVGGRQALMLKMREVQSIETKNQTPVQRALGKLAFDFLEYEMILGHFDFARAPFGSEAASLPPELAAHFKDNKADWGALFPALAAHLKANPGIDPVSSPWLREYFRVMLGAFMSGREETFPRLFPPPAEKIEVWHSPGTVMQTAIQGGEVTKDDIANLNLYQAVFTSSSSKDTFKQALTAFHDSMVSLAQKRGESGHIGMEVHYHQFDYFYKALLCFVFGLLLLAISWVKPEAGWGMLFKKLCMALTLVGAVIGTTGIVIRCLIMERPPVTSLYETIIFITTTGVIGALLTEWVNKKGWALAVASIAGTAGMFLSIRFMNMEGRDTMELLQAVLITNFWLSTHVPIINLGYTAGMVAAIFSAIYLIMRVTGVIRAGDGTARDLTRMAYAFVMAGLFLSLVGTVLGGIWANYSWGRFWGWDPKENGALLIVLMTLVILHARLGGYIGEVGFHNCNLILGMIVAFSWFATNQLGVGLHSYGAMEGAWRWLYIFWGFMTLLLVIGMVLSFTDRNTAKAEPGSLPAGA